MTHNGSSRKSVYTALCAKVLFPLHEAIKGHNSAARLRELEQSQWWSPERIEGHRLQRLREFLSIVGQTVPYYGKLFQSIRFDPTGLCVLADLAAIPLLTKDIIRVNTAALKARDATQLQLSNTGGSSGEPLVFFVDKARLTHYVATKWRATRWWGVDIGDPEIVVWGSPIELGDQDWLRHVH